MGKFSMAWTVLIVGALVVLLGLATWTIFGTPDQVGPPTDQSGTSAESQPQRRGPLGGGPSDSVHPVINPAEEHDRTDGKTGRDAESDRPQHPQFERPPLDEQLPPGTPSRQTDAPASSTSNQTDRSRIEAMDKPEGASTDQERAFREDDAPPADVIEQKPGESARGADSGSPSADGGESGEERPADRERRLEDLPDQGPPRGETYDRQARGRRQGQPGQPAPREPSHRQAPPTDPAGASGAPPRRRPPAGATVQPDASKADQSGIRRPKLRSAPRPSRPGRGHQ